MTSAVIFVLFAVLTTFVGNVTASCKQIANKDMLEYFCEGGHPADLIEIPEITEKLRINRMPLYKITTDTFSRFDGNLWVLGCSHCNITNIDVNAFRSLVNLQQLSLDNNHLTSVKAAWFRGLSYLTYLDLNYNNIHEIEDETYQNLPSLVDFRISGNRLRCLNLDAMSHLKELKFMLLSENPDFACPYAVSKFLESQSVTFEKDPEWKKLASDMIDVHIPSSYAEKDHKITPTYNKLYPDRRPSEKQEVLHIPSSRNKGFYSNNHSEHRPRRPITTIRPTNSKHKEESIPRVEPKYPFSDIKSNVPKSSIDQKMSYPYSAAETTRASFAESRSAETIRMADNEKLSQEYTLTYPLYVSTSETINYPLYTTSERSQTPPEDYHQRSSVDNTRIGEINRSLQTERTSIYPSYVSTYNMPQITSERSQAIAIESVSSSQDETTTGFDKSLQTEHIVTYPLYVTTSSDHEKLNGYIQVTYPSIDYDTVSWKTWSTNVPSQHSDNPSSTQDKERYEQSHLFEKDIRSSWSTKPDLQTTQFFEEHDPRKMVKPNANNVLIAEDPIERDKDDRFQTTVSSDMHYVRPSLSSHSELMHLPSTDESYLTPYYESTVYPPLQNYSQYIDTTIANIFSWETIIDKLPSECPNRNSAALMIESVAVLVLSIIVIFRQVIIQF